MGTWLFSARQGDHSVPASWFRKQKRRRCRCAGGGASLGSRGQSQPDVLASGGGQVRGERVEGLPAGGKRRSFPGCSIPGVPSRTGAKGASACMISVSDQEMTDEALLANADTTPDENAHAAPEPDDTAENDRRADVRTRLLRSLQDD